MSYDNRQVVTWQRTPGQMDCPMQVSVCERCEARLFPVYATVSHGRHFGRCAGCVMGAESPAIDGARREVEHSALRQSNETEAAIDRAERDRERARGIYCGSHYHTNQSAADRCHAAMGGK